jgi:hypothetical protein
MILAILNPPFSWVEPVEKHRCAGKLELNQTLLKAPAPANSGGDKGGVIQTKKLMGCSNSIIGKALLPTTEVLLAFTVKNKIPLIYSIWQ